ncbi:MAG: Mu-like prophage major head subunit gpT family protein [Aggregatilineales bacterium]
MIRQSQFDQLLKPMIVHTFDLGMNRVPSMRAELFSIMNSNRAYEEGTGIGGISPDVWDSYNQSGQKGVVDFNQLYTQTYTHVEYPVRIPVQIKLIQNDQYGVIQEKIRRVGMSAEQKMELDAASLLNKAFTGALWSDGVALCSDSHPLSPKSASGTQDNLGTEVLSKQALSDTRVEMMHFTDDAGNEIGLMPNELWVPPELEDTAIEITKSLNDPSSANNAVNPQNGRWIVKPWLRLTDTNAWFVVDGMWRQEVVKWYVREQIADNLMLVHEDTTDLVYEAKLHYSFGVDDWRWIYGHNPS